MSAGRVRREYYIYFLLNYMYSINNVLNSESTRIDISIMFALLVFENCQLQRSFQKIVFGNLSQQDKTRAVSMKCKLECVLY